MRLRVAAVASGLEEPTDLLPLPDARVLVAERSGRIRILRDGALLAAPAVTIDGVAVGESRGLLALALDRDFAATRHVFAIYTTDDGLRLARLTALGDRLVDHVVLLEALPIASARPAAVLRVGPDGRLYLALDDGADRDRVLDLGSYSGKVLRLAVDGTTPGDQPRGSPIWSVGVSHPVGLAWSGESGTLRVVGEAPAEAPGSTSSSGQGHGPEVRHLVLPPGFGASGVAAGTEASAAHLGDSLLIASTAERGILRVWFSGGDVPGGSDWLVHDLPGPVETIAAAPDGVIYATAGATLLRIVRE